MAAVEIIVGGRRYTIACRDGGEAHLRTIAAHVDRKTVEAKLAVGDVNEARQLLFAALLLADELAEDATSRMERADEKTAALLEKLAQRVEAVADRVEAS